jgi:hypothetical protein
MNIHVYGMYMTGTWNIAGLPQTFYGDIMRSITNTLILVCLKMIQQNLSYGIFFWGKSWHAFDDWMITIGCWDSKFGTTHHVWFWLQFPYLLGSRDPTSPHFRWMIIVQPDPLTFMFPIYMSCSFLTHHIFWTQIIVLVIDPTIHISNYILIKSLIPLKLQRWAPHFYGPNHPNPSNS